MFDFLPIIFNHDERVVDNYKCDLFTVDTCIVTDRAMKYETAVEHKNFNYGKWVILEYSETKKEAQHIHDKWVSFFKNNTVSEITDIFTGVTFKRMI